MRPIHVVSVLVLASASAFGWKAVRGGAGGGEGGEESGGNEAGLEPPPPANSAFAAVLLRMGLGADALAAAGVSAQEADAMVRAVAQTHQEAALDQLDHNYAEARRVHDALERKVRSGRGDPADRTALQAAVSQLDGARTAREERISSGCEAGLGTLAAGKVGLLRRIRANASWGLPIQYLVKDRSETEWVRLRSLVAAKRIAEKDEEELFPPEAASALAAIDAEAEISTAKANLETNLFSVQTAWNNAASE